MRVLAGLLAYAAVVCLLAGGVIRGTLWLIEPDPSIKWEIGRAHV